MTLSYFFHPIMAASGSFARARASLLNWPVKLRGVLVFGAALLLLNAIGAWAYSALQSPSPSRAGFIAALALGEGLALSFFYWAAHSLAHHITRGDAAAKALQQVKASQEMMSGAQAALKAQVLELSQHTREMDLFGQFTELLQACANADELSRVVSAFSRDLFPAEAGIFYLLDPALPGMAPRASWGEPAPEGQEPFHPEECWALRRGKPHYRVNPAQELFCPHVLGRQPAFSFCLPLMGQGKSLGMLHLRAGAAGAAMSEPRQLAAEALAYQASLALSNLKLKEQLREDAIRDPVTGLFNRRFMNESLDHELRRAKRSGADVGVIAFDLDHFKDVNDTFGHAAGDSLLEGLARLCMGGVRAGDICCRQGGDEFLIILPDISENDALALAENLRQKGGSYAQGQFPGLPSRVTLSLGVAMYPSNASTYDALQQSADRALYRAKTLGRDRVFAASSLAA